MDIKEIRYLVILPVLVLSFSSCGKGNSTVSSSSSCLISNASTTSNASIPLRKVSTTLSSGEASGAGGFTGLAQSFQYTSDVELTKIKLKLMKTDSSLSGTVSADIYSDATGKPGSVVMSSIDVNVSLIPTSSASWIEFAYTTDTLSANTTYWIVLEGSYTVDADDYVVWESSSENPYSNGSGSVGTGTPASTWNSIDTSNYDYLMQVACPTDS